MNRLLATACAAGSSSTNAPKANPGRERRHGVLRDERVGSWESARTPARNVATTCPKEPDGRDESGHTVFASATARQGRVSHSCMKHRADNCRRGSPRVRMVPTHSTRMAIDDERASAQSIVGETARRDGHPQARRLSESCVSPGMRQQTGCAHAVAHWPVSRLPCG